MLLVASPVPVQTFGNLNPVLSTTASHLPRLGGSEEGLHNPSLCFLMVVVRPGNRILGRRWEQILGWMWVGLWWWVAGTPGGVLDTLGPWQQPTLFPDTQGDIVNPSAWAAPGPIHTCQYILYL